MRFFFRAFYRFTVIAIVSITAVLPVAAAQASNYAPANRPVYSYTGTGTRGADHVVFNSFINTPNVGDERSFLAAKDAATTTAGGYVDNVPVTVGRDVLVRAYVHNDVDASLNASSRGIARNTRLKVTLPQAASTDQAVTAALSADNADNGVTDITGARNIVSSSLNLHGTSAFQTSYVPGSGRAYSQAQPDGLTLSDSLATSGALLGTTQADGNIAGGFDNVVLVTFKVAISPVKLTLTKQVTVPGSTAWATTMTTSPGETVSWLLTYTNASEAVVSHLTVADVLPAHVQLVPGSVMRFDSLNPQGQVVPDAALFSSSGFDTGALGARSSGYVRYRTTVDQYYAPAQCQALLTTPATAHADNTQAVTASATVTVKQNCTTPVPTMPSPEVGAAATPTPSQVPTLVTRSLGPQLPDTGAGDMLACAAGLSGLSVAGRAYLRSRRQLALSLKR